MEFKELIRIISDAGYKPQSYIYQGEKCLSVTGDDIANAILNIIKQAVGEIDTRCGDWAYDSINNVEELIDQLKNSKIYSEVYNTFECIYWPHIKWED